MNSQRFSRNIQNVSGMGVRKRRSRNSRRGGRGRVTGARNNQNPVQARRPPRNRSRTIQRANIPLAFARTSVVQAARINGTGNLVVIKHKEMLGTIQALTTEQFFDMMINPGRSTCFPWLSRLANNFERFRFRSLVFKYVPTCSVTTPGFFSFFVEYDPADATVVSYDAMTQNAGCMTTNFFKEANLRYNSSMNRTMNNGWFNTTAALETADLHMYYPGKLEYYAAACSTAGAGMAVGQLWVDYEVELQAPQSTPPTRGIMAHIPDGAQTTGLPGYIHRYGLAVQQIGADWDYIPGTGLVCAKSGSYIGFLVLETATFTSIHPAVNNTCDECTMSWQAVSTTPAGHTFLLSIKAQKGQVFDFSLLNGSVGGDLSGIFINGTADYNELNPWTSVSVDQNPRNVVNFESDDEMQPSQQTFSVKKFEQQMKRVRSLSQDK